MGVFGMLKQDVFIDGCTEKEGTTFYSIPTPRQVNKKHFTAVIDAVS
jgi:hypothetical protein